MVSAKPGLKVIEQWRQSEPDESQLSRDRKRDKKSLEKQSDAVSVGDLPNNWIGQTQIMHPQNALMMEHMQM